MKREFERVLGRAIDSSTTLAGRVQKEVIRVFLKDPACDLHLMVERLTLDLSSEGDSEEISVQILRAALLSVQLGVWQIGKPMYVLDKALYKELIGMASADIPISAEAIRRVNHWSVAVEVGGPNLLGYMFTQSMHQRHGSLEVICSRWNRDGTYETTPIHLRAGQSAKEVVEIARSNIKNGREWEGTKLTRAISEEIAVLMYLCSEKPEVTERVQGFSIPTMSTGIPKNFSIPKNTKLYDVGKKQGKSIQKFYKEAIKKGSKKAHVRCAHWHGYWTGKRDGSEVRKFDYKWIEPTFINLAKGD